MLDVYGGLTAEQITNQVEALAGSPRLNHNPTTGVAPASPAEMLETPAYVWLNQILEDLYTNYEWAFLESGSTVWLSAGARVHELPTDFLDFRFDDGAILLTGEGTRIPLIHLSPEEFFKKAIDTATPGQPQCLSIDRRRSQFQVHPIPDRAYASEWHYRMAIAPITVRTAVPMFPNKDYLVKALTTEYYQHQNDTRLTIAMGLQQAALARCRQGAYAQRDSADTIPLDSHTFLDPYYDDD